ncbi:PPOX class F420-dependent oxidoreductase [Actinoalloteichus hymeniacidonis]|uniref:PPOX class putative F420-dependent enzyme n=1 Tax=Actinoalloteichus hymeniacidonis TaxID=340345 RepID=A0AAC9HRZ1_9PSEU|nr:PPOX class F420-dependent oxidoreductase [Actinoalloteichus hymeniacidonis]AOS64474.1 PPOX class putative F420-dependent enzyme [Actinoalloteichus hymeniacidonis]MBB5907456.1 PPOX class probable F420-dependent enzyme [Actinoalloteichus hymeniacidonis]
MAVESLPPHVVALLEKPNPAVMATLRKDGTPVSVATWYLFEKGRILLNLDATRTRLAHLRRDPRVALTVIEEGNWYKHVSIQGRVVSIEDDPELVDIDRLSTHYGGKPYPNRTSPRVSVWVEIQRWHGWNIDNG